MPNSTHQQPADDEVLHTVAEWGWFTLAATVAAWSLALFITMQIVGGGPTATRLLILAGALAVGLLGVVLILGRQAASVARATRVREAAWVARRVEAERRAQPAGAGQR